ncbi:HIRAN domain-containing protein [Cupriavidus sp. TMH.W2]|uniref:HIRAN domain-containing protein n=1 Tax=Cupriavidus sp. TMH.W2 TaxID=3434465 RepID=UPI003D77DFE2
MRRASTYLVKGIQYYEGPDLVRRGILKAGEPARLVRERDNPYDPYAVAVYAGRNSSKIGHISRDHSQSVSTSIDAGEVESASIQSVDKNSGPRVYVCITFSDARLPPRSPRRFDRLTASVTNLPRDAGVYRIECAATGSTYIGSTACLHERALNHLSDLRSGRHVNHLLQQDFLRYGPEKFRFVLVEISISRETAEIRERDEIEAAARRGEALYNRTTDGKGRLDANSSTQSGYVDLAGKLAAQARRSSSFPDNDSPAGSSSDRYGMTTSGAALPEIPPVIATDSTPLLTRLVRAILRFLGY